MNGKDLTLSIISFMLGVVSIVLAWFGWYAIIAMVLAISGVVLSSLAIKSDSNGLAVTGMVLSIIGIVSAFFGTGAAIICSLMNLISLL